MTTRDTAAEPCPICGPKGHDQHEDDSYGGCVLCRQFVPHTDDEYEVVPFPCPAYRLAAIEAEAASGPALTTGDVAKALIESDLIPRYLEYARLSPSMNPAETVEHIAATWAPRILARLAAADEEPTDG